MSFYYLNLKKASFIVIITIFCQIKLFKGDSSILNSFNYRYPKCIALNNDNFLIIFSSGIYVFNSDISEEISKKEFESGFSLNGDDDMNLINLSKFDDGVIIAIIKTYLYIFSSSGEYIHNIDLNNDIKEAKYYSLIPIRIEDNNIYYFAITFMSSQKVNIFYYKINKSSKTYEKIDNIQYSDTSYTMGSDLGLTCLLMMPSKTEKEMVCFYKIQEGLEATSFKFDNKINIGSSAVSINSGLSGFYKSAANSDKTKALICRSDNGNGGKCIFYNIIENSFSEDIKYFKKCQNIPKGVNVYYFEETKEFVFSCGNGMTLSIIKFDSDGNIIGEKDFFEDTNFKFPNSGFSLCSYSIIFFPKYSQYSILYSINYENSFHCLLSEEFTPLHIYDKNKETNIEKINQNSIIGMTEKISDRNSFITDLISSELSVKETVSFGYSDIKTNYENYPLNESENITSTSTFISEEATSIEYSDIKEIVTENYSTNELISEKASSIEYSDTKEIITENYSTNESTNIASSFISEEASSFENSDIKETITENYSTNVATSINSSFISEASTLIKSEQIETDFRSSALSELMDISTTEKIKLIDTDKANYFDQKECSKFLNGDIKCLYCNEESLKLNKCIECNKELGYYPVSYKEKDEKYVECYNNQSKLNNFYFDSKSKTYNLCYELCNTCDNGGNQNENNCTSCISGYMLNPDIISSKNCIYKCSFYYYYNSFSQLRCINSGQCPLDNSLLVRPKKKCVNNCNNDSTYIYQYNSECLEKCPDNTNLNEFNICEDNDINICSLSTFKFDLNIQEIKGKNIELSAIKYAREYSYTDNHISQFENDYYSFILYKNSECINKLSLNFSTINFRSCYDKIQSNLDIEKNLIISIISIKSIGNKPVTIYEIFDPETGNKINDIENICKDDNIIISENLLNYLKTPYLLYEQKIDIFNLSGSFYTDICYHFESPYKKDVPLKDRILSFYPNISLCDSGCNYKGVNLETFEAECECKINNFVDNYLAINNIIFINNAIGETINFIKESNIFVLKCYKDLFHFKYYIHNNGFFIISSLFIIQIVCAFIFLKKDLFNIKKYIYYIIHSFIKNNKAKIKTLCYPPKKNKKKSKKKDTKKTTKKTTKKNKEIFKENFSSINESYSKINKLKDSSKINRYNSTKKALLSPNKNNEYKYESNSNCNLKKKIYSNKKIETNNNIIKDEGINFKEYLKIDLDDLDFDEALDKDKRKFCEIFINKVQEQHMIVRIFFISDKIRPRSIKILLFALIINFYFDANALMYNEEYISKLYNSNKEESFFSFLNNLLSRVLSALSIDIITNYLIELYFENEKFLKNIFLRNLKNIEIKFKACLLIKRMEKKYKYFIIISFLITMTSCYYIFCFNNVYPYTSVNWIKSSFFIIVLVQLISFVYIFFDSFMRLISFKCRSEWLYKISQI